MASTLIDVKNLTKDFGVFRAVDDLSFGVERGEILGFLGPNGAGKSTTMRMLAGFLTPSAGRICLAGADIATARAQAQTQIGYLPEGAPSWPDMTPRGFLRFMSDIRGLGGQAQKNALERAIALTELHAVLDQPIETLSKGFRRRVGLAQAILHAPQILIMDEPTDGLDPNQKHQVRRAILDMARDKAIIISTHILEEVEALCDRALLINHGSLVAYGTPAELAARSRYHNAVVVTVDSEKADAVATALTELIGRRAIEIERVMRGAETIFTLIMGKHQKNARALLAQIDASTKKQWGLRSLALERGRLDDVFRALTQNETSAQG